MDKGKSRFLCFVAAAAATVAAAAIVLLGAACVPLGGGEAFGLGAPEIVWTEAEVSGTAVTLSGLLSESRAEHVGFAYGPDGGEMAEVECAQAGGRFETKVGWLTPGMTYGWYAFARAGESEVRSEVKRFTIEREPEPEDPGIEIPDTEFRKYLLAEFDTDGDGKITAQEARKVRKIEVVTTEIFSLEGIAQFPLLDTLICRGVGPDIDAYAHEVLVGHPGLLQTLDLSENKRLRYLRCDGNALASLILPEGSLLNYVACGYNCLQELDLSGVRGLVILQTFNNNIREFDLSGNPVLGHIEVDNNPIDTLDVTDCPKLWTLNVQWTNVRAMDVSKNPNLGWLGIGGTAIQTIDLSHNTRLEYFHFYDSSLTSVDLSFNRNLKEIKGWNSLLTELDVSMLPKLKDFDCAPMGSLQRLYVAQGQEIPNVTENRNTDYIPDETDIVVVPSGGK